MIIEQKEEYKHNNDLILLVWKDEKDSKFTKPINTTKYALLHMNKN